MNRLGPWSSILINYLDFVALEYEAPNFLNCGCSKIFSQIYLKGTKLQVNMLVNQLSLTTLQLHCSSRQLEQPEQ